jgi:hypothetical protein
MMWLVILPAILGCAIVLTDLAHSALHRLITPKVCLHEHRMYGRCVECGTPL